MHLFLGLSGAEQVMDISKKCLNSQAFWTKRTHGVTGKVEDYKVQGVWRPIEFGHYVFPEEHLNSVLNMLSIKPGGTCEIGGKNLDKYTMILRKILNLKKIPYEIKAENPQQERTIFWHEHLNIIPVGIKEDTKGLRKFGDGIIYDMEHL